jgi:hypothetical protein
VERKDTCKKFRRSSEVDVGRHWKEKTVYYSEKKGGLKLFKQEEKWYRKKQNPKYRGGKNIPKTKSDQPSLTIRNNLKPYALPIQTRTIKRR